MQRLCSLAIALPVALHPAGATGQTVARANLTDGQKLIAERTLDFGFAFGDLIMAGAMEHKLPPIYYGDQNAGIALEAMRTNYSKEFAMQRSAVKLLDASLNVAIAGGVVVTGGMPAILAGSSLGYVKTKAMGALGEEVDRNAKIFLAGHLNKFTADNGLDYEQLRRSGDPDKIRAAIDKNGLLNDAIARMAGDPVAAETLRAAVVHNIQTTQKATLDQIKATNANVAEAQTKLLKVAQDLRTYTTNVTRSVESLQGRASALEAAMQSSQNAIESLTKRTASNAKDLRIVGDVLFSQSPPAQKLQLLRADFYGDMNSESKKDLITQLEGEVKKQKFVEGMQDVVGTVNSISTIAKNLNLNLGPDVDRAISLGNVASQAVTAYLSGNPVAAVAAVSSLFGRGAKDPAAARHAAMMLYLRQEFSKINLKLDKIIDLQVQTLQAMEQLAVNIETLQKQMHARFDFLGYEIDTIQQITRSMVYDGINHCFVLRDNLRMMAPALRKVVIPEMAHLEAIAPLSSFTDVERCISSLRSVLALSTKVYSNFSQSPLAVRLSGIVPNSAFTVPSADKLASYRSKVQEFDEAAFQPTFSLVTRYPKANWPTTPGLLWSFAMPARTVRALDLKVALLGEQSGYCIKGTFVNKPIVNLLCPPEQDSTMEAEDLPATPAATMEGRAIVRAGDLLRSAMIQEPLADLGDLTLFFSAVAETQDLAKSARIRTRQELLNQSRTAQAPFLLANALKANAVAIAQGGMLYGDLTALALYEMLWNGAANRFRTLSELAGADSEASMRQVAYSLIKSNPYLLKNVAMIALHRALNNGGSEGEDLAYRFALDELARESNDAQLSTFFNSRMSFNLRQPQGCNGPCPALPTVQVVDLDAPLPTSSQFAVRQLDYPMVVEKLERLSDMLAARLVAYDLAKSTARNASIPLAEQALILTTFNGK
jgi:hypothetical protein